MIRYIIEGVYGLGADEPTILCSLPCSWLMVFKLDNTNILCVLKYLQKIITSTSVAHC